MLDDISMGVNVRMIRREQSMEKAGILVINIHREVKHRSQDAYSK